MHATTLKIKKLRPDAEVPTRQTAHAAGLDLVACLDQPIKIQPSHRIAVPTGLAMEIETGFEGQLRPRSGLAIKHGITLINSPGTIDADYRGEVKVLMINLGQEPFTINSGDRIAQLLIAPVVHADIAIVDMLTATPRGGGGFGSTGT